VETLTPAQLSSDFPQFQIPAGLVALYESNAGYLLVEECVRAQIQRAEAMGATLQFNCPVMKWSCEAGSFTVSTAAGQYRSQRLVFCCGPWTGAWLSEHAASLQVVLKHLYWFQPADDRFRQPDCPVFLYELPHGLFYGVPAISSGVKVGEHSGGIIVPQGPDDRARKTTPQDRDRVTQFVQSCLPGLQPPISESTCWYTMSPDGHFLVDESATTPGLYFVAGLSGHGFKFAPVLGEIVADLVTTGSTAYQIAPFRASRF
jgi:glycine/D-amino acid oxidase-like deaminating enzyme